MTKYHIEKTKNGYNVHITTEYKTHSVNITDELLGLRMIYYSNRVKDKQRLVGQWIGGKRLNDLIVTKDDNVNMTIADSYILCDLALSQAITNMIDNAKGVTHYGL